MLFLDVCKYGSNKVEVIENALPPDTKFLRATVDNTPGYNFIGLIVESASFKDIPYGNTLPYLPSPVFRKAK